MHLTFYSRGYNTGSDEPASDADTEEMIEQLIPEQAREKGLSTVMKKPVEIDRQGEPFGPMKAPFSNDIKKYARDLDPRFGWEGQPKKDRRRLFRRLYSGLYSVLLCAMKRTIDLVIHCCTEFIRL